MIKVALSVLLNTIAHWLLQETPTVRRIVAVVLSMLAGMCWMAFVNDRRAEAKRQKAQAA